MRNFLPILFLLLSSGIQAQNQPGVHVDSNHTVLFGSDTTSQTNKFIWYPTRAAIRAGRATTGTWNNETSNSPIGFASAAFGFGSYAKGNYSFASGLNTVANSFAESSFGQYSLEGGDVTTWTLTDPLFEIGNGLNSSSRANALTILKNGFAEFQRSIKLGDQPLGYAVSDGTISYNGSDIQGRINGQWQSLTSGGGGITGIIAGAGLIGGGSSGAPTITAIANNGLNVDATADRIQLGGALNETTTINNGIYSMIYNLNSTGDFLVRDNGVNRFSILDNGRTAVGATTTAGMFNVTGNSFFSDDLYLRDGSVTGVNLVRIFDSADDGVIDVYRAGTVANRIHGNGNSFINAGNFGLGTTAPVQKLHVIGTGRYSLLAGSGNRLVIANNTGDLLSANMITTSTSTAAIDVNGTGFTYAGYFAGDIFTTGTYLPSFKELKKVVKIENRAMDKINKINIHNYKYRTDRYNNMNLPKGIHTGVMSEEIKKVFPELVKKTKREGNEKLGIREMEFEAVNYTGLIPHMIQALQEQEDRIQTIVRENQSLKEELNEIKEMLKKQSSTP